MRFTLNAQLIEEYFEITGKLKRTLKIMPNAEYDIFMIDPHQFDGIRFNEHSFEGDKFEYDNDDHHSYQL